MRIAILRADLSQPIYIADLEQVSQDNRSVEPRGQTRYITRPSLPALAAVLNQLTAYLSPNPSLALPLTLSGSNNVLRLRAASTDSFVAYTIATGTYSTRAALLAAINTALASSVFQAVAHPNVATAYANGIALATRALGPGSRIELDTVANGSNANTILKYPSAGGTFTMPTAAGLLTALIPVGGPASLSQTTISTAVGLAAVTTLPGQPLNVNATLFDILAPRFIETDVAIKSLLVGNLSKFRSASFNPDPNRLPALTAGAALSVLDDSGTALTYTVPTLTNAQVNTPSAGIVTLTGTGLASKGTPNGEVRATKVKFMLVPNAKVLDQATIVAAGGTVSSTSIIIPASLVPVAVAAGTKVQVQYTSLASNVFTLV